MVAKNSTGSVITMEAVPKSHQVGIAWVSQAKAQSVGFVYDEDETLREDVIAKIASFAAARKLEPFGDVDFAEHLEKPYSNIWYEEISQDVFLERFGAYPRRECCLFDEGGSVGDNRAAFGIPKDAVLKENDEAQAEMRAAGVRAGFTGLLIMIAFLAAFFCIAAFMAVSTQASLAMSALTLLCVLLAVLGAAKLVELAPKLARALYRKSYK